MECAKIVHLSLVVGYGQMYPGIMMTAATMCSPGLADLLLRIFQKKSSIVFIPEDNWQTKQHRRTATDATNKGKVAQTRHRALAREQH